MEPSSKRRLSNRTHLLSLSFKQSLRDCLFLLFTSHSFFSYFQCLDSQVTIKTTPSQTSVFSFSELTQAQCLVLREKNRKNVGSNPTRATKRKFTFFHQKGHCITFHNVFDSFNIKVIEPTLVYKTLRIIRAVT